jgi:hypothetical protein
MYLEEERCPTDRQIARFEEAIKDDILWAVKYGPGFDPDQGVSRNGTWHPTEYGGVTNGCGVCAIGAHCLRWQPVGKGSDDITAVAKSFGLPESWVGEVYWKVTEPSRADKKVPTDKEGRFDATAANIASRLRRHGKSLMKKEVREQLRHEAGMEAQMLAERLRLA